MSKNDRYVTKHPKGWAVKVARWQGALAACITTQREAEKTAKAVPSGNLGGGEVRIQNRQGTVARFGYGSAGQRSEPAARPETLSDAALRRTRRTT